MCKIIGQTRSQIEDLVAHLAEEVEFNCQSLKVQGCSPVGFDFEYDALDKTSNGNHIADTVYQLALSFLLDE